MRIAVASSKNPTNFSTVVFTASRHSPARLKRMAAISASVRALRGRFSKYAMICPRAACNFDGRPLFGICSNLLVILSMYTSTGYNEKRFLATQPLCLQKDVAKYTHIMVDIYIYHKDMIQLIELQKSAHSHGGCP